MSINPISAITSAASGMNVGSVSNTAKNSVSFTDVFNDALQQISDADKVNQQSTVALLSGDDEGLETTMIAAEKAKLTLSFGIAVRNKIVEAYNEIIKMQV